MTPDEVVKVLEEIIKYPKQVGDSDTPALQFAITLLQDYQKLRERVSVEKIAMEIEKARWNHNVEIVNGKATNTASKNYAQAIVTYLQQPTEPIER